MRGLFSLVVLACCGASAMAQSSLIDVQNMTARTHDILLTPERGANIRPGVLVDMANPRSLIKDSMQLDCKSNPSKPITGLSVAVVTSEDSSSTYRRVALAVEASLSFFGEGSFDLNKIELERVKHNSFYARIDLIDGVESVAEGPRWPAAWRVPAGELPEKLIDFVDHYGTHYIQRVYTGRSISIKATLLDSDQDQRNALAAKLKAGFLAFKLDAKFAQELKQQTAQHRFSLYIR